MNEKEFAHVLCNKLKNDLIGYEISNDANLLYKIIIDESGKIKPDEIENPIRGRFAFQTDILIKNEKIPLLIVEVKFDSLTTHDVLTYSTKAMRHKEIYPYLRYGLVVGKLKKIPKRFFTHNQGFDFAMALENIDNENELNRFTEVIKEQLEDSVLRLRKSDFPFNPPT